MKNTAFIDKLFNIRNIKAIKNLDPMGLFNLRGVLGFKNSINLKINNKLFRIETINKEDYSTYYSIFFREDYKVDSVDFQVIFDFGANIGLSSLYFLNKFPHSNIFSYEPDPITYNTLLNNVVNINNIKPCLKAIGIKKGYNKFYRSETGKTSGILKKYVNDFTGEVIKVEVDSISLLLSKYLYKRILIKMDVEGLEMELLEEISRLKNKSDWYIILEKDVNFNRSILNDFEILNENDLIISLKKN